MNKLIKNILALVASTIILTPALHGEDTQAPSTSKLQSAINYVKNIRTPLTPQETLTQFIAQADVTGFKNTYNSIQEWTHNDRNTTLQTLTITAQEAKQTLQAELEKMGNTPVNKKTLVKGTAQVILGTYCTLATLFCLAYKGDWKKEYKGSVPCDGNLINWMFDNQPTYKRTFMCNLARSLTTWDIQGILSFPVFLPQGISKIIEDAGYEKLAALTNIIITPLTGYLAYNSLESGVKHWKNGWNYKAYLEQQIANINEINEFIQAQLTQQ